MLGGAFCCIRRRPTFVSKLLGLPISLCILNDVFYTFGFTIHFPLSFVLSILFCIMLLCDGLCADRFSMVRILLFIFYDTSQSGTKKEKKKAFSSKK
jgi:hypothetical protein